MYKSKQQQGKKVLYTVSIFMMIFSTWTVFVLEWFSVRLVHCFVMIKKKLKWSRYRPCVAQRMGRAIALLFHDRGTRMWWVVSSTPRPHFTPAERPGTHFRRGWVGPRVLLDGRKISFPPGFDPRTVQPVVSRYTDWATRPSLLR